MNYILYHNVSRLLKSKRMQRKDLAEKMGCSPAFVSNALSGNPTMETLQKIAQALSVPVAILLREPDAIVGFVEINGKSKYIDSWDDIYELIRAHERTVKNRTL